MLGGMVGIWTTVVTIACTLGVSYGPGVHVREADLFVSQNPEWSDVSLRRYVRLGAVFPDLRSGGVALPVNTHDKAVGAALLAIAEVDGTPWKLAFAHGYRLHTASDTAAQVLYLPWLNGATDLQQVNLFGRTELGPVGDNELLIEGYGDLHSGSLQAFVDTAYDFLFQAPDDLDAVVDLFVSALAVVAGEGLDEVAARSAIDGFWSSVESTLDGLDPGFVALLIEQAGELGVSEVIELLTSGLFADLLGSVPGTAGELEADPHEMLRLEAHPAGADPEGFFSAYEDVFAPLGVEILGDPGYEAWPWYRDVPIVMGMVQGFALGRPDVWAHHPDILLWRADFEDELGAPLEVVQATGTKTIRASSELFLARPGPEREVRLEVYPIRADSMGLPSEEVALASATAAVRYGPVRTPLVAELVVSGASPDTLGYAMRWRVAGDAQPFLETWWPRYAVFADAPLFRQSYEHGVAAYLPTVRVARDAPVAPTGWVRGHTVLPPGHRGVAAEVTVTQGVTVSGHPGGGFFLGQQPPGTVELRARATGYVGGPAEVEVTAGDEARVRIDLRAIPIPEAVAWSPHADRLEIAFGVDHFQVSPDLALVTLRREDSDALLATWQGDASEGAALVEFEHQEDGTRLVPMVSMDGGEVGEGGAVTIDSTPPTAPVLSGPDGPCGASVSFTLTATDDLAPVMRYELSLDGEAWLEVDGAGGTTIDAPVERPFEVMARAQNASGLWSAVSKGSYCAPLPALDEGDASQPSLSEGDPSPVSAEDASPPRSPQGCEGGRTRGGTLMLLGGLAILGLGQRRRARLGVRDVPQGVIGRVLVGHG